MGRFKPEDNPFAAGTATQPGYLAGRDEELRTISLTLSRIAGPRHAEAGALQKTPLTPIKIVGPRGVGKTTLLGEAREMAKAKGVCTAEVTELKNLQAKSPLCSQLIGILRGKGLWGKVQKHLARVKGLTAASMGVTLDTDGQQEQLRQILEQCLQNRPLALLMDEAMEYDAEALESLLRVCQQMINNRYPLAVFLAGTPNLDQNLTKAKASFIYRTKNLYINALAPEATREALQNPFVERGAEVRDGALQLMMEMTDDYPFFTQLVGHEAWNAMALADREEVDEEIVLRTEAKIQQGRDEFYQLVYGIMDESHLVEHALHVMEVLELNGGRAARGTMVESLANSFANDGKNQALEVFHKLIDLGFIWRKYGEMEPGLPSFFTFCKTEEKKKKSQTVRFSRPHARILDEDGLKNRAQTRPFS